MLVGERQFVMEYLRAWVGDGTHDINVGRDVPIEVFFFRGCLKSVLGDEECVVVWVITKIWERMQTYLSGNG